MRRAPLALLLGTIMMVSPLIAAAANNGGGQASNGPTVVTLLNPLVGLPGTVASLDFLSEKNGKVKHSPSAGEDLMKFASHKANSVAVHLSFDGTGTDIDAEMAALLAFAKVAGASNGPVTMTLVWGHLGAFDVELRGFNESSVTIKHDHVYQHHQTDLEFLITHAGPSAPARDIGFEGLGLGGSAWLVDFAFEPTVNWSPHRTPHEDAPDLEFTSGEPRSMSLELMFEMYEDGADVYRALLPLVERSFDSTSPNATGPVDFTWGHNDPFRGLLVHFALKYTMFLEDGTPVRAVAVLNLTGVHRAPHGDGSPGAAAPLPYVPSVSFDDPPLEVLATMIAFNAWVNETAPDGEQTVDWQDHRSADDKPPEYKTPRAMNLSVELLFDTYEQNASVNLALGGLLNLSTGQHNKPTPQRVTFTWGNLPGFEGVLESISVKYTMFLPDGKPVRATVGVHLREANQTRMSNAEARVSDHGRTNLHIAGSSLFHEGSPAFADITLEGPMTGPRQPMVDWMLEMASLGASSLQVVVHFGAPTPSAGAWQCTQVTYTPPQFTPNGAEQDKVSFHAEVLGLKEGETVHFGRALVDQACTIDQDGAGNSSHARERPDEFVKATGFRVDINGNGSEADTFSGGEVKVALNARTNTSGHYGPGKPTYGSITLTRAGPKSTDWGDWFNASQELPNRPRVPLNLTCTGEQGGVVSSYSFEHAFPLSWYLPDMDSDKSGMIIEEINITVEKVERA